MEKLEPCQLALVKWGGKNETPRKMLSVTNPTQKKVYM